MNELKVEPSTALTTEKRKRGRPRTRDPKEAKLYRKFDPVTWKPIYDQMVYYHVMGMTNKGIVDVIEKQAGKRYTVQQISNILTSDKARKVKAWMLENLRKDAESNINQRLGDVADKFMKKIEVVVENESLFEKAPLQVFDRGLRFIAALGLFRNPNALEENSRPLNQGAGTVLNIHNHGKMAVISGDSANTLMEGLQKAMSVQQKYLTPQGGEVGELPQLEQKVG